jgi:hypothetical protein
MTKKRVAIIGGGTGVTLAWLLTDQFDVTLFEANSRLGGHINSLEIKRDNGETAIVEGGAEFLDSTYKHFYKLLEFLKVPLKKYTMTMEFIDLTKKNDIDGFEKIIFSPNLDDLTDNFSNLMQDYQKEGIFGIIKELVEDAGKIGKLITLKKIITYFNLNKSKIPPKTTLEQFLKSMGEEEFGDSFLYPVIGASWGIHPKLTKKFLAFYALNYLLVGSDFNEVVGGLSRYINALHDLIKENCTIHLNSKVSKITQNSKKKYCVNYVDKDSNQITIDGFDEIVMCTNAEIAAPILSEIPSMTPVCDILKTVEYYDTTICFHEAPDDNKFNKQIVVHTVYDGELAVNSALKSWNSNVMKSWILDSNKIPEKHYDIVHYRHPYMYESYYNAQICMKSQTNLRNGISFGSILADARADSHESGILAAINVARNLTKKYNLTTNEKIKLFDGISDTNSNCCGGDNVCCVCW